MTEQTSESCRTEIVDGSPVRVRGAGDWGERDQEVFIEVVRAALRRHRAENCLALPGCDGTVHQVECNNAYFAPAPGEPAGGEQ